jgi:hypothetical protein
MGKLLLVGWVKYTVIAGGQSTGREAVNGCLLTSILLAFKSQSLYNENIPWRCFMKQDRFLTGILIGIGVLVIAALVLFFTRQDVQEYRTDDAPDAIVFNYVLAVLDKDYEKAYGYLADLDDKPSYDEFRKSFVNGMVSPDGVGVDVGSAELHGEEANVELNVVYAASDPFGSGYSNSEQALLVRQDDAWKLSSMPYNFWDYNWYQPIIK